MLLPCFEFAGGLEHGEIGRLQVQAFFQDAGHLVFFALAEVIVGKLEPQPGTLRIRFDGPLQRVSSHGFLLVQGLAANEQQLHLLIFGTGHANLVEVHLGVRRIAGGEQDLAEEKVGVHIALVFLEDRVAESPGRIPVRLPGQ